MKRPLVLIVLDGWGIAAPNPGNAVSLANLPYFDYLWSNFPHAKIHASGESVGLPRGEAGNTETGHINLGAGRIIYQDLPRINMAIADGSFYKNEAFLSAINFAKKNHSQLHLMGLIGSGGVHANNEHLFALLYLCKEQKMENVFIHVFTDGRDSPPTVALDYVRKINEHLRLLDLGKIASVSGRYYAMDRDLRWERIQKTYNMLTKGNCSPNLKSAEEIIRNSYENGITDEFIIPASVCENGKPAALISKNDSVIFYNFRIDRPRELTKAFVSDEITPPVKEGFRFDFLQRPPRTGSHLERSQRVENLFFVTMTEYEKNLAVKVAFPQQLVPKPLGRVISEHGLRQLKLTESEKERFVTFYFNGQRETPFIGEDRLIIPSLEVATYDLAPEMRSKEITSALLDRLKENIYDLIVVNYPNADMVGHSGVIPAAVAALEATDESLEKLVPHILNMGGVALITADHGNCEEMINVKTGGVNTEHSNNLVPLIIADDHFEGKPQELRLGVLGDIAPTILEIMGIEKPVEMTGRSLLS